MHLSPLTVTLRDGTLQTENYETNLNVYLSGSPLLDADTAATLPGVHTEI